MRSVTIIQPNADMAVVKEKIGNIMVAKGYVFKEYKNQQLWKKGNGWLTAPQFFNFFVKDNKLHIESWIKYAILPGVYAGEIGMEGVTGFAVKIPMRNIITQIVNEFKLENTEPEGYMPKQKEAK